MIDVFRRYDHVQPNIKLPKKEYRIFASKNLLC